jgi:uncharacterized protein YjbI with pentapeptide repeats
MANEEHLALLRQGVDAWNEWKANNPGIRPDLSFATGKRITIRGAKLSGVDLSRTNLSRVDLSKADLIGANLSEAYLREAYLSEVELIGADLRSADLRSADLISSNLIGANLSNVYLSGAYLRGANFKGANLKGANFRGAYLSGANLQRTKALDTNFNKAVFTEACLEDWHTNSATNLDEVICDYVYLQADQKERSPSDRNFAPGEFTELFQKALETVDLIFRNGIDWQAFLTSFQKVQVENNSSGLSIQAIENKNKGTFVIRVNVPPEAHKAEVEKYLKREYESELKAADKKYRYQLQANYEQIATYREQSTDLIEIVKVMAGRTINLEAGGMMEQKSVAEASKDDQHGGKIVHVVETVKGAIPQQSIQDDYALEQKPSLKYTAAKIQKLLEQLEEIYPTNTPLEKQMVVTEVIKRIESNPSLKAWVREALKGVSTEALKQLIDHPLVNVLLAALEGYQAVD